jgi:hypothetical protein
MSEVALLDGTANIPLLTEVRTAATTELHTTLQLQSARVIRRTSSLQTLKAQGHDPIPGYRNLGLHPYAIALAEGDFDIWGQAAGGVLCALRWPQPSANENMEIPIVLMARGGRQMQLVARSAKEYTTRVLVEEDLKAGALLQGNVAIAGATASRSWNEQYLTKPTCTFMKRHAKRAHPTSSGSRYCHTAPAWTYMLDAHDLHGLQAKFCDFRLYCRNRVSRV